LYPLLSLDTVQAKKKGTAIGVVCNLASNTISLLDPATQTLHGPYLKSLLGTGGVIAVAITHNGRTAVISDFGGAQLHFVDLSAKFDGPPVKLGTCNLTIFAEDLAITPNDKYVLVTDGGLSSRILVVDITTMTIAGGANCGGGDAQAIAVSPDGETVLAADYLGGALHVFKMDPDTGMLMRQYSIYEGILPAWPVNVTISPDGRTAVMVTAFRAYAITLRIDGPGAVTVTGQVPLTIEDSQTAVFSPDGKHLYIRDWIRVAEFKVTGPGMIEPTGRVIWLTERGTGQFYGVNTMAIDPSGTTLYITNPTSFGTANIIDVLDVGTFTATTMESDRVPTGIDFGWIAD